MIKAMIVAPHPDDAELAMGGTIAKMIDAGWDVTVVDLSDGEPTPSGSRELRQKETERANQILGIQNRICLYMPNRYLQATLENRRRLAEVIRLNQPKLLFGPVMPDYHPDHIEAANLIAGARFEAKFHKTDMQGAPHWVGRQYYYYSTHRACYDKPSFIVDITDSWERKARAIQAYQSQIKTLASAQSFSLLERMEVIGRYFGQCIGTQYGEPFVSCEPLHLKELEFLGDFY
ncbi:MAG TPA: bacillithiol biosynthesis deacetylase BshB1 [Sedimentisphaerales bacterium]|nr:bacillithiol biosynthesis deacetylase BshB1 [Sedimentisphaerales bacterium]